MDCVLDRKALTNYYPAMRRFLIKPSEMTALQPVLLRGDEFHHLKNVCRLEEGERVELLDGAGQVALATITGLAKRYAELQIEKIEKVEPAPIPHVKIGLCVPRFQKMDLIIQKCVELGAQEIMPVVSERSFVRKISSDLQTKVKRWQKIADEACKQAGRAWPLTIREFATLRDQVEKTRGSALFLYEGEGGQDIRSAMKFLKDKRPDSITVFIGPEGGFSPSEVELYQSLGFSPITLGGIVLRVETACIAILSIIQYEFDHLR